MSEPERFDADGLSIDRDDDDGTGDDDVFAGVPWVALAGDDIDRVAAERGPGDPLFDVLVAIGRIAPSTATEATT